MHAAAATADAAAAAAARERVPGSAQLPTGGRVFFVSSHTNVSDLLSPEVGLEPPRISTDHQNAKDCGIVACASKPGRRYHAQM